MLGHQVPGHATTFKKTQDVLSSSSFNFKDAVKSVVAGNTVENAVESLLFELTADERLSLLDGDVPFWPGLRTILSDRYNREPFVHGHIPRLGIPGVRFTDGPRGIVMGASTAFPVSMSRGATWDVALEEEIGLAIGREGRAQGANYFAGICINLPRHPAWGRIQETYGEDPLLLGAFGAALTTGVRANLMTCVKHFALNSMENARFRVDVQVDDAALHEVYLAHFRHVVKVANVDSVMSSYNSVRGEWAGQSKELLSDILRDQWGFDGFVLSDFIFGLRDAVLSVKNGLDIEAPFSQQRAQQLRLALESGELKWSEVDTCCRRILKKQIQYTARTGSRTNSMSIVSCDEHRRLARDAAAKGIVLLKNEETTAGQRLLPLDSTTVKRIAIIGRLANAANTGDRGSSHVHSSRVVTPVEGIIAAFPNAEVLVEDSDCPRRAGEVAQQADIVLCIVGYNHCDEGEYVVPSFQSDPPLLDLLPAPQNDGERETYNHVTGSSAASEVAQDGIVPGAGGDRRSLRLRAQDVDIISATSKANANVIVSVIAAGPVITKEWIENVPAMLFSWYGGCEGGHALADVLSGRVNACGRLPFSIPTHESHLPSYDMDATKITYDRWFGQRLLDKLSVQAHFPLGYGLSYTSFSMSSPSAEPARLGSHEDKCLISATITNNGPRSGRFVAQVYGKPALDDFPSCLLLGFAVVELAPQESRRIEISTSVRPLLRWTTAGWIRPGKLVQIELAAYQGDPAAVQTSVFVGYS